MYLKRTSVRPFDPMFPELEGVTIDALVWMANEITNRWSMTAVDTGLLESFLANRIMIDPAYRIYYAIAAKLITTKRESPGWIESVLGNARPLVAVPNSDEDVLRDRVIHEFIAFALASGGFRAFGATNYCGFVGGGLHNTLQPPYRMAPNVR